MFVPRFSTRTVLIVTAACAVLFLMIGMGMRGAMWAAGVAIAASSLLFMALVHAALFGICYAVGRPKMKTQRGTVGSVANPPHQGLGANSAPQGAEQRASGPGIDHAGILLAVTTAVAILFSTAAVVQAGTGGVVTLPPTKVKPKSGLRVTVDSTWVENFGYMPFTVTVTAPKPVTADQTITFRFKASTWRMGTTPVMSVDQDIELLEGAATATATVLVPKLQEWNEVWWDVLVDGSFEKELSFPRSGMGWFNQMGQISGDESPRILVVADDDLVVNVSVTMLNMPGYQQQGMTSVPIQQSAVPQVLSTSNLGSVGVSGLNFATQKKVADLPTEWLAYSGLDYVALTPTQLAQIQDENPQAWTAIERWVRSGGNLWLHDVAAKDDADVSGWDGLDAIVSRLAPLLDVGAEEQDEPLKWFVPYTSGNMSPTAVYTREAAAQQRAQTLQQRDRFAWRPAHLGAVLVSQRSLDQVDQEWNWLQEPDGLQLSWHARHGTIPNQPNLEFANLLIPGVGLAPVTEFRILITLFVVLIGPMNYWLLKRSKRLHLLILTVPLAACLVTLALFGYAVIGDGFSARVRAISYTSLDQRAGEATSWARLSYYAGLAPSDGLRFPKDTAVYPINSTWSGDNYYRGEVQASPRAAQWADHQYLTEGWLASRTPTQYLTIAARKSDRGIDVSPAGGGVQVQNRLGADIELLVLRDRDGRLYVGESIDAGGSANLSFVEKEADVTGRLREIFSDREPAYPEAFQAEASRMRSRYGGNPYGNFYGGYGVASSSRLMQRIDSFTQPVDSRAPTEGGSGRSVNVDDGTYLAITKSGVDLATGLDDPDEEASFHLVEGRW